MKKIITLSIIMLSLICSAQVFSQKKVKEISQKEFSELVFNYTQSRSASSMTFLGSRPCIVDFNATWCGPCRRMAPVFESLADEYDGKVDFYSVDIDENKELAKALGIRSIPFLLFCPVESGAEPVGMLGFHPREDIVEAIDSVLQVRIEPIEFVQPIAPVSVP